MSRQIEVIDAGSRGGLRHFEILNDARTLGDAGPLVPAVGKVVRWKSSGRAGWCAAPAPFQASSMSVSVIPRSLP